MAPSLSSRVTSAGMSSVSMSMWTRLSWSTRWICTIGSSGGVSSMRLPGWLGSTGRPSASPQKRAASSTSDGAETGAVHISGPHANTFNSDKRIPPIVTQTVRASASLCANATPGEEAHDPEPGPEPRRSRPSRPHRRDRTHRDRGRHANPQSCSCSTISRMTVSSPHKVVKGHPAGAERKRGRHVKGCSRIRLTGIDARTQSLGNPAQSRRSRKATAPSSGCGCSCSATSGGWDALSPDLRRIPALPAACSSSPAGIPQGRCMNARPDHESPAPESRNALTDPPVLPAPPVV
jgi:hypothetical protein